MSKCRQDCLQLDSNELDLVVLSCIQSHLSLPDQATQGNSYHDTGVDSQKRSELFVGGIRVCRATFLFVYTLSHSRYEWLVQHYKHVGLSSRLHGNKILLSDMPRVIPQVLEYRECEMYIMISFCRICHYRVSFCSTRSSLSSLLAGAR